MKRGLVIGKFLPVHNGHIALIRFAALLCDELIVSMSYTANDVISPMLRFSWLQQIFKDEPHIRCAMLLDDFDNESLPLSERTRIWAARVKTIYPPIDVVVSSEEYGKPFAGHLNAESVLFDPSRKQFPVSSTLIRTNPFLYWDFIPDVVRPYFVKKVCFYGPESTGKTVMAQRMAEKYNTGFVPEVARELITSNVFSIDDIIRIGYAHEARVREKILTANKILFCDTDAITTQVYARHYLGEVPPVLHELEKNTTYDHYFLFDIDVPWVADGLRDLGDQREVMFNRFKQELDDRRIQYTVVRGTYAEREEIISAVIDTILQ